MQLAVQAEGFPLVRPLVDLYAPRKAGLVVDVEAFAPQVALLALAPTAVPLGVRRHCPRFLAM